MSNQTKFRNCLGRIHEEVRELATEHYALGIENDKLVERSVGAMSIAEGDEGHEKIPRDCPMLHAVSAVRELADSRGRELTEARSDRQREHDLRVNLAGEVEALRDEVTRLKRKDAFETSQQIRLLEAEVNEGYARCAGLVYHIPGHITASEVQAARKAWADLQTKAGRLEAAANDVLKAYMMPQFNDSRAVDDCLVALAAAVVGAKTETPLKCECGRALAAAVSGA
jgi:hypothetical protein